MISFMTIGEISKYKQWVNWQFSRINNLDSFVSTENTHRLSSLSFCAHLLWTVWDRSMLILNFPHALACQSSLRFGMNLWGMNWQSVVFDCCEPAEMVSKSSLDSDGSAVHVCSHYLALMSSCMLTNGIFNNTIENQRADGQFTLHKWSQYLLFIESFFLKRFRCMSIRLNGEFISSSILCGRPISGETLFRAILLLKKLLQTVFQFRRLQMNAKLKNFLTFEGQWILVPPHTKLVRRKFGGKTQLSTLRLSYTIWRLQTTMKFAHQKRSKGWGWNSARFLI